MNVLLPALPTICHPCPRSTIRVTMLRTIPKNYRPVSLTSQVVIRIILDGMLGITESNETFSCD